MSEYQQQIMTLRRFAAKAAIRGWDECWEWTGSVRDTGYGAFRPGGDAESTGAHRWAFEHFVGPIPDGMELDHLCRNRRCVNPLHLKPVTPGENQRRSPFWGGHKMYCKHGHPFTPENTRMATEADGVHRKCRECDRIRSKEYRRRRAAGAI